MKKAISLTVCIVFLICSATTAFAAENYQTTVKAFTYNGYSIPAYDGDSVEVVNKNKPTFSSSEKTKKAKVQYGKLDSKGRCTAAFGDLNKSLMPTGKRGSISSVYPTGWEQEKYDCIPGKYLYNRCHLIGWQLTGADLNNLTKAELSKNLITGTRFLNVGNGNDGMVGYENKVSDYLKANSKNYVAYRVTPVFQGNNLVASGVLMEGESLTDDSIKFCVFCYNVQPNIAIDYATGKSKLASALETSKSIGKCTVTITPMNNEYTGSAIKPAVTIKDGSTTLKNEKSYKLTFKNNTLPGKASVQIVGMGDYKGTLMKYFIIFPEKGTISSCTVKTTSIKAVAKASKGVTGYQFSYRVKNGSWKNITSSSKSKTISGLKKKTNYEIKVRSYKTIDGTKYYGKWSAVKQVKTK